MGVDKAFASIILLLFCNKVSCEYFTSISELKKLVEAEVYLVKVLEKHISREELVHHKVEKFLNKVETNVKEAKKYDDSPKIAKELIKESTINCIKLKNFFFSYQDEAAFSKNFSDLVAVKKFVYPTNEDLSGASKAFVRLQQTYNLKTAELARGIIQGHVYSAPLSSSDCFWLGNGLQAAKNELFAVEWLTQACHTLKEEGTNRIPDFSIIPEWQILEHLARSHSYLNNSKLALSLTEEILSLNPNDKRAAENLAYFKHKAAHEHSAPKTPPDEKKKSRVYSLYKGICSGELKQSPSDQRDLRCRYSSNNVPFCLIAPFKMEELNLDPLVRYFHDVIYDSEIEKIFNVTDANLQRSRISDSNNTHLSEIRISQQTWLNMSKHAFLDKLAQRLKDLSGLTLDTAESLQVANYGIAGHYGPHYDFFVTPTSCVQSKGNRILTALFYINDVKLGGATAFPFLRLAVPPIKRNMLMWYNLHESLELDFRTKHAGCPVLVGSKWILNEWFRSGGQEFKRPCGLTAEGNVSFQYAKIT